MYITHCLEKISTFALCLSLFLHFEAKALNDIDQTVYITDSARSGSLTNDGYPSYIAGSESWNIVARPGFIIRFEICVGSIGDYWNQGSRLEISDAVGLLYEALESHTNSTTMYTISNEAWVKFIVNNESGIIGYPIGFKIAYEEVSMNSSGEITLVESDDFPNIVYSNSYPNYYANGRCQAWFIRTDPSYVIDLRIETASLAGTILVYDGNSTQNALARFQYSNYATKLITSTNEAFVVFVHENDFSYGLNHGFTILHDKVLSPMTSCQNRVIDLTIGSGTFGTITNDYFPFKLETNSECGWLVKSHPGSKIGFGFSTLKLINSDESCWGNVTIYNGDSMKSPAILSSCFVRGAGQVVHSSTNVALVMFFSSSLNPADDHLGFALNYAEVSIQSPVCSDNSEAFTMPSPSGIISSSGYPYRYDSSSQHCHWNILVSPGYAIRIKLSVGNIYRSIDSSRLYESCNNSKSNGYPWIGVSSMFDNVEWQVATCYNFYQAVYVIPSNQAIVTFYPGLHNINYLNIAQDQQYPLGFTLTYDQVLTIAPCREVRTLTVSTSAVTGMITSDDYPLSYDKNSDCHWIVSAPPGFIIKFTVLAVNFSNSNCDDSLTIYEGPSFATGPIMDVFCGQCSYNQKYYYTSSNTGSVRFKTGPGAAMQEAKANYSGFRLLYQPVRQLQTEACRTMNVITLDKGGKLGGVIENTGYPWSYEAYSLCKWRIIAPSGYMLKFKVNVGLIGGSQLEEAFSLLSISEGFAPCGETIYNCSSTDALCGAMASTSEQVATISFESQRKIYAPESDTFSGFQIEYKAVASSGSDDSSPDLLWLWILLGLFSGLFVLIAAWFLVFRPRRQSSGGENSEPIVERY